MGAKKKIRKVIITKSADIARTILPIFDKSFSVIITIPKIMPDGIGFKIAITTPPTSHLFAFTQEKSLSVILPQEPF